MRVLLADDRAKVRSALRLLLEQQPDVEILGEAVDTTGLLDWVKAVRTDLVLLDWELPGLPSAALLPLLQEHQPNLQVIALSGRPEAREEALKAKADAFVSKGDPPDSLLNALDACRKVGKRSQKRAGRRARETVSASRRKRGCPGIGGLSAIGRPGPRPMLLPAEQENGGNDG